MDKKVENKKFLGVITGLMMLLNMPIAGYEIKLLSGCDMQQIAGFVAEQRLHYFREYPYLYEGNLEEEAAYLQWLSTLKSSAIAIAYVDNAPVGFITGASVQEFDEHFTGSINAFSQASLNAQHYYYFAEVIIQKNHRGNSLCTQLFAQLEEYAKSLGYSHYCFADESHDSHPLKPQEYINLAPLWKQLGYTKSEIKIAFPWNTIQPFGAAKRQDHTLCYWIKSHQKQHREITNDVHT